MQKLNSNYLKEVNSEKRKRYQREQENYKERIQFQ